MRGKCLGRSDDGSQVDQADVTSGYIDRSACPTTAPPTGKLIKHEKRSFYSKISLFQKWLFCGPCGVLTQRCFNGLQECLCTGLKSLFMYQNLRVHTNITVVKLRSELTWCKIRVHVHLYTFSLVFREHRRLCSEPLRQRRNMSWWRPRVHLYVSRWLFRRQMSRFGKFGTYLSLILCCTQYTKH